METYQWLGIGYFVLIALLIGFLKAVRDIILFRFEWSILSDLPAWIRNFLLGKNRRCRVCDGFHLTDGIIIQLPALFILALLNPLVFGLAWWWIFPQWAAFFLLFYLAWFNPLYHYILMKREFKGRKNRISRKNIKQLLVFIFIFILAGCQDKKEDGDSNSPDKVPGGINPPKREGWP